ncbi:hypothetical protein [Sandarakinorhabdus sp.]|uniref:flagellar hook-length control protein FliK n=1 Tax=Sandarakinorhabdus sp. TaxID=1916663 RepID=UPI00286E8176|nr:hypothetical protein [Sandarakinorhabdus sp.]
MIAQTIPGPTLPDTFGLISGPGVSAPVAIVPAAPGFAAHLALVAGTPAAMPGLPSPVAPPAMAAGLAIAKTADHALTLDMPPVRGRAGTAETLPADTMHDVMLNPPAAEQPEADEQVAAGPLDSIAAMTAFLAPPPSLPPPVDGNGTTGAVIKGNIETQPVGAPPVSSFMPRVPAARAAALSGRSAFAGAADHKHLVAMARLLPFTGSPSAPLPPGPSAPESVLSAMFAQLRAAQYAPAGGHATEPVIATAAGSVREPLAPATAPMASAPAMAAAAISGQPMALSLPPQALALPPQALSLPPTEVAPLPEPRERLPRTQTLLAEATSSAPALSGLAHALSPLPPSATPAPAPAAPAAPMVFVPTPTIGDVGISLTGAADALTVTLAVDPGLVGQVAAEAPRLAAELAEAGVRLASLDVGSGGANRQQQRAPGRHPAEHDRAVSLPRSVSPIPDRYA